jgi:hypothetical protein
LAGKLAEIKILEKLIDAQTAAKQKLGDNRGTFRD